ncbi:MAG: hypothetical protein ABW318_04640 [Vicinamibacterales bacterium]
MAQRSSFTLRRARSMRPARSVLTVTLDALPGIPPQFSITGHLIRDTVTMLREGLTP